MEYENYAYEEWQVNTKRNKPTLGMMCDIEIIYNGAFEYTIAEYNGTVWQDKTLHGKLELIEYTDDQVTEWRYL